MAQWYFEPGHTAAEFAVRHMMLCFVRGAFKNVQGTLNFYPEDPGNGSVEVRMNASAIWSGDEGRDDHLCSADFMDADKHSEITFSGSEVKVLNSHDYRVTGGLRIRGVTKRATLDVTCLGQWQTPWWEDGEHKGPKTRAGFLATSTINRHDLGVRWNGSLDKGGIVVGDDVRITIDAEAILDG